MEGAPAGPGWSRWPAPAKLNLFLHITGRRPDGYHALQTVFRLLDWGDRIHLRPRADGQVLRHGAGATAEPADDLAVRAACMLRTAANSSQGVDIAVEKCIPQGGGFGGGSSDAATVLVAANALWGTGLDVDELAALGRDLGADVPVFIHGRNAWAEGVGDELTPLDLPDAWYVLLDPAVHAATASLFQDAELTRHAAPATIADFVSGSLLDNVFEPVLRRREPAVEAAFGLLARIGRPRLTGSGSGCFVEFADRGSAEAALATLPRGPRTWLAAGARHSPLLDALNENRLQGRRQEAQGTRF